MGEKNASLENPSVRLWRPVQKKGKKRRIVTLIAAGVVVVLGGILFIWGYMAAIITGLLIGMAAILIYFALQKKLRIEDGFFYLEQNELYLISLDKRDDKLRNRLQEEGIPDPEHFTLQNEILNNMTESSMICHILTVDFLGRKKNGKYKAYITYDVIPYPYTGFMTISLKNCYEDYDSLIRVFKEREQAWQRNMAS